MNLNIDLKTVDTSMPKLVDGDYLFSIVQTEVLPSKIDPSNRNLVVQFSLEEDGETKDGVKVRKGFKMRKYFPLQQSPKPDAPDFRRDIAILFDCAFNLEDVTDRPVISTYDDFKLLHGKQLKLRIATVNSEEYGEQNEIKRMLVAD